MVPLSPYNLEKSTEVARGTIFLVPSAGEASVAVKIGSDSEGDAILHLSGSSAGSLDTVPQYVMVPILDCALKLPTEADGWTQSVPDDAPLAFGIGVQGAVYIVVKLEGKRFAIDARSGEWSSMPRNIVYAQKWSFWTLEDDPRKLYES